MDLGSNGFQYPTAEILAKSVHVLQSYELCMHIMIWILETGFNDLLLKFEQNPFMESRAMNITYA